MIRKDFLTEYEKQLLAMYAWTKDVEKLDKFMSSVENTLAGGNTWNSDGDAVTRAWSAIGGKGKPTLKALRKLDNSGDEK